MNSLLIFWLIFMTQTVFYPLNKNTLYLLALFALLQTLSMPAKAAKVEGLHSAAVRVSTQSVRERRSASQDALAEVFIRASGKATVVQNQAIQALLSRPDRFILSFGYQSLPADDEGGQQGFLLTLDFDAVQINQSLRTAGLPVWGDNRPELLLWWAVEDEQGRRLVNSDNDINSVRTMQRHAKRRGIPTAWPLLDLQDRSLVKTSDVWGFYLDKMASASKRYGSQAVIIGRARQAATGRWFGRWFVLLNGQQYRLEGDGSDLNAVMQEAMDFAADKIAEQYAEIKTTEGGGELMLKVTDVNSLADYADLNNYLGGLSVVGQVTVKAVHQRTIWYALQLQSDVANFEQVIRLDRRLKKQTKVAELPVDELVLEYRWAGF